MFINQLANCLSLLVAFGLAFSFLAFSTVTSPPYNLFTLAFKTPLYSFFNGDLPCCYLIASLPLLAIAACSGLPATFDLCSTTVKICILRA